MALKPPESHVSLAKNFGLSYRSTWVKKKKLKQKKEATKKEHRLVKSSDPQNDWSMYVLTREVGGLNNSGEIVIRSVVSLFPCCFDLRHAEVSAVSQARPVIQTYS